MKQKHSFTKTKLFYCPIYKIKIDPNSYDKEKIISDIKYNKSFKNTRNVLAVTGDNCDTHQSYKDFDNEDFRIINYEKLEVIYLETFEEFFNKEIIAKKNFDFEFEIVNYSALTKGQWLPIHNHLGAPMTCGSDFATIHYLNYKNDHILTRFANPATFAPYIRCIQNDFHNTLDNTAKDNSYLWEVFSFGAEEDDMIIFPAALNHEIPMQGPTKEPRITISSNIRITKEGKYDENKKH